MAAIVIKSHYDLGEGLQLLKCLQCGREFTFGEGLHKETDLVRCPDCPNKCLVCDLREYAAGRGNWECRNCGCKFTFHDPP